MTRTATAAGVTNSRHFGYGLKISRGNLVFNRPFRDEEAGADKRFITGPLVARSIAEITNRSEQRIACEFWTMLSVCFQTVQTQVYYSSFRRSFTNDLFSQQRCGSDQNRVARSSKLRLRHDLRFIDLDSEANVRATDYRRGTPCKARAICIDDITRIEEMIGNCCW